jgi:hypothetical protein
LEKLRRELTVILRDPVMQKRLLADAAQPKINSPAEIRKMIHDDVKKWTVVAKQAGIHVKLSPHNTHNCHRPARPGRSAHFRRRTVLKHSAARSPC